MKENKRRKTEEGSIPSSSFYWNQRNEKEKEISESERKVLSILEERKNKAKQIQETFKIYCKQLSAIQELERIEREYFWMRNIRSERKLRVFCFEWNENLKDYLKEYCTNYSDVFKYEDDIEETYTRSQYERNRYRLEKNTRRCRQSRYFLLVSFECFFPFYQQLENGIKHFYEVILNNRPCFLYFDIDRKPGLSKKQGEEALKCFSDELQKEFKRVFNFEIKKEDIVELESTSTSKFSYHILVKPLFNEKEIIFRNNTDCGNFVKNWICKLEEEIVQNEEIRKNLFYRDEEEIKIFKEHHEDEEVPPFLGMKCIIDKLVYTSNRHFRIVNSSKKGKNVEFKIDRNKYSGMDQLQLFLHSMITKVNPKKSIVLTKVEYNCKYLKRNNPNIRKSYHSRKNVPFSGEKKQKKETDKKVYLYANEFSKLHQYIINEIKLKMKECNIHGNVPIVRAQFIFKDSNTLILEMGNNRFCERIRREHRSNHVFYVCNLNKLRYHQKCTDGDCKNHIFQYYRIPWQCLEENAHYKFSEELRDYIDRMKKMQCKKD